MAYEAVASAWHDGRLAMARAEGKSQAFASTRGWPGLCRARRVVADLVRASGVRDEEERGGGCVERARGVAMVLALR